MKLILAIVNQDDAAAVLQALTKNGFAATKISSTGGFLLAGNATILMGVDKERVQPAIDVIKQHSRPRQQIMPLAPEGHGGYYPRMPTDVAVSGATIFVLDIEHFERA